MNYTEEKDAGITCQECARLRQTTWIGQPPKCYKHRIQERFNPRWSN